MNRLQFESSPYLLQHAHNPVDWYPWGEEALSRARAEQKPILVSIGYSACHWCHVMERESFEDPVTAELMNLHFINIKIDREERPDLDHIYMDAVQAMTGSGGWPLNVFLTPEGKPFYGGTYFPPVPLHNRPSWKDVLLGLVTAFRDRRNEIDEQAAGLTTHLIQSNSFGLQSPATDSILNEESLLVMKQNILRQADTTWGGFGRAPKFPQTGVIQFLLRYYHGSGEEEAFRQADLSLRKMGDGGLYDQVGGGYARYSTDSEWLVPHFEKMLYDNALLVSTLAEAYSLKKDPRYLEWIRETLGFIQREMLSPEGGFYAALDADSEGEEGKYYTWSLREVMDLLPNTWAGIFCQFFDITEKGNWEGKNILWRKTGLEEFAASEGVDVRQLADWIEAGKKRLLEARERRIRPGLDDKIILGWNALQNTALTKAYAATGEEEWLDLARRNMEFLLEKFRDPVSGGFLHTYKAGKARFPAFLDDLAFLIEALISLQEVTGETKWLVEARQITENVLERFPEPETGYFFFTPSDQSDVIVRKKEVYDGAVPSGNAVMARNLRKLAAYFDIPEWESQSRRMTVSLGNAIIKYPTSFSVWAGHLWDLVKGLEELAVTGKGAGELLKEVLAVYIPNKIIMCSEKPNNGFPLLYGKGDELAPNIYYCHNYSCSHPVNNIVELRALMGVKAG